MSDTKLLILLLLQLTWPNHVLFSEKIMNLTQSISAVLEIPVSFAIYGEHAVTKVVCDLLSFSQKYLVFTHM